jgi:hypothetical protein
MHLRCPGCIIYLDLAFRPRQPANLHDEEQVLVCWKTINGSLYPKVPGDEIVIPGMVDSALGFAVEEHGAFTSLLNSLSTYLTILKHKNIT